MEQESEVARWHRLSGLPDNVTDDGQVVARPAGAVWQAEKTELRATIERLMADSEIEEVRVT